MVETLLNTHTGAAQAQASNDAAHLRNVSRPAAAPAPGPASALNTVNAPALTASTVAPDVLLAAHQARDTARPRAFDANKAYGGSGNAQNSANVGDTNAAPRDQEPQDGGAEIIPLRGNSSFSSLLSGVEASPNGDQPGKANQSTSQNASQAYVHAGAADGRGFGATGLGTTGQGTTGLGTTGLGNAQPAGAQSPIDLII